MLFCDRNRALRTGSGTMESCRPAIIVSFGVTAHWRRRKGANAAGIDSRQSFVGVTPYDSKHLARSPLKRGRAGAIFMFSANLQATSRSRSVPRDNDRVSV